jgi:hypothetical protein
LIPCSGKVFLLSIESRPALGPTQLHVQWVPWIKRPRREADLYPSTAEVKNGGNIPPLHHTPSWHDAQLIEHRDNFTFTSIKIIYLTTGIEQSPESPVY